MKHKIRIGFLLLLVMVVLITGLKAELKLEGRNQSSFNHENKGNEPVIPFDEGMELGMLLLGTVFVGNHLKNGIWEVQLERESLTG